MKSVAQRGTAVLLIAAGTLVSLAAAAETVQSLRGEAGIDETVPPPEIQQQLKAEKLPRNYRQQPPLIPHRIQKYQIDLRVNQCLSCHDWPQNVRENAPKVSETHYVDRNGVQLDGVARTRWFCTQCHVTQEEAIPLVENTFTPLRRPH